MAVGMSAWQIAFEISPIILTGGKVDGNIPGGMLPIMLATEAINFPLGILTSGNMPSLDEAFAHFAPLAGASVIDQQIATYPFANQETAANAVITQPLRVSFTMTCPVRGPLGYWSKLAKMTLLIKALEYHNSNGGTYALITPSFIYFNCLMRGMRDTSSGQTKQVQNIWTLDFEKPLLTVEDAESAEQKLNNILQKLDDGTRINGTAATTALPTAVATPNPTTTTPVVPAQVPVWPG